jgi:hypothetical protein
MIDLQKGVKLSLPRMKRIILAGAALEPVSGLSTSAGVRHTRLVTASVADPPAVGGHHKQAQG